MSDDTDTYTIDRCIENLVEGLESSRDEILSSMYPEDLLHEIVDGCVPIYNTDRVACLMSDLSLAEPDDPSVCEGMDVFSMLGVAIYERLSERAHEWLSALVIHVVLSYYENQERDQ